MKQVIRLKVIFSNISKKHVSKKMGLKLFGLLESSFLGIGITLEILQLLGKIF